MRNQKYLDDFWNQRYFIAKMALFGSILYYINQINFDLYYLQQFHAYIVGTLLNLTYSPTTIQSQFIQTEINVYEIIRDCTGWKSFYLYSALIISTRKLKNLKTLKYLISGLFIIFLLNLIRLYTTVILSELGIISFEVIHGWIWNSLLLISTMLIWLYISTIKKQN